MLFAGWAVCIVRNCDRGLENAGRGQHFQDRGHSFSLYGPTLSRQITYFYLFFSTCDKLAYKWVDATLSLNWLTNHRKKKSNERTSE